MSEHGDLANYIYFVRRWTLEKILQQLFQLLMILYAFASGTLSFQPNSLSFFRICLSFFQIFVVFLTFWLKFDGSSSYLMFGGSFVPYLVRKLRKLSLNWSFCGDIFKMSSGTLSFWAKNGLSFLWALVFSLYREKKPVLSNTCVYKIMWD